MIITQEGISLLFMHGIWILSLAICLGLMCFKIFRNNRNPLAWMVWLNLAVGAIFYLIFPAVVSVREAAFKRSDPGYAESMLDISVRSVHILDMALLEKAAYWCSGVYSSGSCEFPIGPRIKEGALDFIEVGSDPVVRYQMRYATRACLEENKGGAVVPDGGLVVPALGVCVLGEEVASAQADFVVEAEVGRFPVPSSQKYIHVSLRDRASGEIYDQFDGWKGAEPYFLEHPVTKPRRPRGVLGKLVNIPYSDTGGYQRGLVDETLKEYGFDEGILMQSALSEYQKARTSAVWLACRDQLAEVISPENKSRLREVSATLFKDSPNWRYPESCPDWAR